MLMIRFLYLVGFIKISQLLFEGQTYQYLESVIFIVQVNN